MYILFKIYFNIKKMAINELIHNKISWTFLWLWLIAFPIFWIELLWILTIMFSLLQTIDFLTGYIASRRYWMINSRIWFDWMIRKSLIYIILLVLISWVGILKYSGVVENNYIWLIPIWFLCVFSYLEIVSIFENFSVIFGNSKEWVIFKFLSNITNLLFKVSLDKLKENTEKRIQEKFNTKLEDNE